MLSKRKPKYSTKNLSTALQVEIDPLVNKVGVHKCQKDPSSPIHPMYLNPTSCSYQWASWSHVFISYLDPAISSKLHPPTNDFFECFPYAPKLLSTLRLGEISVQAKNLSRICNQRGRSREKLRKFVQIIVCLQSLTLKYFAKVFSLKVPLQFHAFLKEWPWFLLRLELPLFCFP